MLRKVAVGLWCGALVLGTEHVLAAEPAALSWSRLPGAEGCPGLAEVSLRVEQHLKRRAFVAPGDAKLLFEAMIAHASSGGWHVRIVLFRGSWEALGTRDLELAQTKCSDAVDAAALALALMIDPDFEAHARELVPAPPTDATTPARVTTPIPVVVTEPPRLAPCPTPVARERPALRLSVGPWLGFGVLPKLAIGVFGALRFSPAHERVGVELSGGYLGPRRERAGERAGGDFWVTLGGLSGWWVAARGERVALSLALGLQLGMLEAEGFGFANSHYESAWLVNVAGDLELSLAVSQQFRLLFRPSLLVPTRREAFDATSDEGTVRIFAPGRIQLALTSGLAFVP
jgi:hypothetical protein